ncbi:MAG TPA: amidohydrolase family protein [Acidimicrobiales bacterium]|jgi:predicted TIM-barrel fold metal-dependent hydrolase|nr:amidohydrolase family protein [Acidimicrobiales bacterium]
MAHTSAQIRADVGHPIIDTDGHMLELIEASHPYLREALGPARFERFLAEGLPVRRSQAPKTMDERRRSRTPQGAWWGTHTTNVLDRATATLPALLYERMEELGLDYSVLYPTNTLTTGAIEDDEMRRGVCAGFNDFYVDIYGPFADRFTAAGYIPMHTPEEAIAELHHCKAIGLKVVVFPEGVLRPLEEPAGPGSSLWLYPGQTHWLDVFALDSIYDYDPVWQTCVDLGFAVTFHGGVAFRPGLHTSISSYVANHIGQFAAAMYPMCKALHLGGVTRRFPQLPFVFLECGVSWGVQLLSDTIEHWEKRNIDALRRNFDPARLDREQLADYYKRYGGKLLDLLPGDPYEYVQGMPIHGGVPEQPDEFARLDVSSVDDIVASFVDSFYFGCEADDRGITTAFSPANPRGANLRPVIGSDIGHWDVTDIAKVVVEAHELVEEGFVTPAQFRAFTFDNAVRMYTAVNPSFFDGTAVAPHLKA